MFFSKEGQTLYLDSWNYNGVRVINALAGIITEHGGHVKPNTAGYIENRSISEKARELENRIERCHASIMDGTGREDLILKVIDSDTAEVSVLHKKADASRVAVDHPSYIQFILNGFYYSFSIDSNPFFDHHYIKTPLKGDKVSRDACMEDLPRLWIMNELFSMDCTQDDIQKTAEAVFELLTTANNSFIRRDSYRRRVANTYNNKYHYEIVYAPERFEVVNF